MFQEVDHRPARVELRDLAKRTFTSKFDHLQELSGRLADDVVAAHAEEVADT